MVQSHYDPEKEMIAVVVSRPLDDIGKPFSRWQTLYWDPADERVWDTYDPFVGRRWDSYEPFAGRRWDTLAKVYKNYGGLIFFFTSDDLEHAPDYIRLPGGEMYGFGPDHIIRELRRFVADEINRIARLLDSGLALEEGANLQDIVLAEVRLSLADPKLW